MRNVYYRTIGIHFSWRKGSCYAFIAAVYTTELCKSVGTGKFNVFLSLFREEDLQPHIVSVEKLYKDSYGEQVRKRYRSFF